MKYDNLSGKDKYDILCEMANMYYNQGKTKLEIAAALDITRFKVATLLQEAKDKQIVNIKINYKNLRNKDMESSLMQRFPLKKAVVVNTQFTPYLDGLTQLGQTAAAYLDKILTPHTVLGVMWGKSVQSVIRHLPQKANNPVTAIQLAGHVSLSNASLQSEILIRSIGDAYFGPCYFLNAPLYIKSLKLKEALLGEPTIAATIQKAKEMTVAFTGIGGTTSLPFFKPQFAPYLTAEDKKAANSCIGSLFGYILAKDGSFADIPLNKHLMSVPESTILSTPRRIAVVYGKHKVKVTDMVLRQNYINELITDADTASILLE